MKSKFDTLPWSKETELPHEQCMTDYLKHLTSTDPNKNYQRSDIETVIAKEFAIPTSAQEALGPKSNVRQFSTSVSWIIDHAIQGIRHSEGDPFLKRIAYGVYQHISGNGELSIEMRERIHKKSFVKVSKRLVGEAIPSVKILQRLGWEPERIVLELNQWSDEVIEAAIKKVFSII